MEIAEFIPGIVDKVTGIVVRKVSFQILALTLTKPFSRGLGARVA